LHLGPECSQPSQQHGASSDHRGSSRGKHDETSTHFHGHAFDGDSMSHLELTAHRLAQLQPLPHAHHSAPRNSSEERDSLAYVDKFVLPDLSAELPKHLDFNTRPRQHHTGSTHRKQSAKPSAQVRLPAITRPDSQTVDDTTAYSPPAVAAASAAAAAPRESDPARQSQEDMRLITDGNGMPGTRSPSGRTSEEALSLQPSIHEPGEEQQPPDEQDDEPAPSPKRKKKSKRKPRPQGVADLTSQEIEPTSAMVIPPIKAQSGASCEREPARSPAAPRPLKGIAPMAAIPQPAAPASTQHEENSITVGILMFVVSGRRGARTSSNACVFYRMVKNHQDTLVYHELCVCIYLQLGLFLFIRFIDANALTSSICRRKTRSSVHRRHKRPQQAQHPPFKHLCKPSKRARLPRRRPHARLPRMAALLLRNSRRRCRRRRSHMKYQHHDSRAQPRVPYLMSQQSRQHRPGCCSQRAAAAVTRQAGTYR
jgi:hypothetical protein